MNASKHLKKTLTLKIATFEFQRKKLDALSISRTIYDWRLA